MITGALLLRSELLSESIHVYLQKRVARLALPFIVWSAVYFAWRFFVHGEKLTPEIVVQNVLTGPYYHFWFFYMLVYVYLAVPLLRPAVAYSRRLVWYVAGLAFSGSSLLPLFRLVSGYSFGWELQYPTGYISYLLLGYLLRSVKFNKKIALSLMLAGTFSTMMGTYWVTNANGGALSDLFYNFLSAPVFLTAVAAYLLLKDLNVKRRSAKWFFASIGASSLTVYFLHALVLESVQKGYFGFQISVSNLNPIVAIPVIALVVFAICIGATLILRKVKLTAILG
jgi:surface polysaccharide O-acyltransferase-like enzyme